MLAGLLLSKIMRPSVPPRRVERPRLIERCDAGLRTGRSLTLVSAPAGFGKTTCICQWLDGLGRPTAWLSLDQADDDPARFVTYLIAAIQQVHPEVGKDIEAALRSGQLPSSESINTLLVNDLLCFEQPCLLVIDDFQVIQDPFALQVMEKLVTTFPPPLHIVLITREDPPLPLARLRANGQLSEVRAADLRFAPPEVRAFLDDVMELSLSQNDIDRLEDKTEGWIVGLQLASLSIRDHADPSRLIAGLSGSHRHILSYLTEEVLNRQDPDLQRFLLQTSILDRLSGALCDAVTGRNDSDALLEQLCRANLFLLPLDDEQLWYRYHHLFADSLRDLLRSRLKEQIVELHHRASHWYADQKLAIEAVEHALAVPDYALAVQSIEGQAMDMYLQWHFKTVNRWMQAIPVEWRSRSPKTNLAFAWMHLLVGNIGEAAPFVERLQMIFAESHNPVEDPSLRAQWLALQAALLNAQGRPAQALDLANQALIIVPEQDYHVRSLIYMGLALASQLLDDYTRAVEAYQMLIQHGRAADNLASELLGITGLGLMALQRGQLHFAFAVISSSLERIETSRVVPPIVSGVYGELGQLFYQWYDLEKAQHYFRRSAEASASGGFSDAELYQGIVFSRLFQIQGDLTAAAEEIQKVVVLMQSIPPAAVREEIIAQRVRLYLAQDRLGAAEAVLRTEGVAASDPAMLPPLDADQPITFTGGLVYNSALRVYLHKAIAQGEPDTFQRGMIFADRLLAVALRGHFLPIALETLLLRAKLHAALDNPQASLADYAGALELAEPEGIISPFLEEGQQVASALSALLNHNRLNSPQATHARRILAAFAHPLGPVQPRSAQPVPLAVSPRAVPVEPLFEPLTDRELDVLRLMEQGLQYQEIGDRLYISLNTVRSYVKAIYSKLDVNNRAKAITRAHNLHLI